MKLLPFTLLPLLLSAVSCVYAPIYKTKVIVGENVADFARDVGPVFLAATFDSTETETGIDSRVHTARSLLEVCSASDGEVWFRKSEVWFWPADPLVGDLGEISITAGGIPDDWAKWDDAEPEDRQTQISVSLGSKAPCWSSFSIGLDVRPLAESFGPGGTGGGPVYECVQERLASNSGPPIAQGPSVDFQASCADGLGTVIELGPLTTESSLVDLPENYPEGAPRPERLNSEPADEEF